MGWDVPPESVSRMMPVTGSADSPGQQAEQTHVGQGRDPAYLLSFGLRQAAEQREGTAVEVGAHVVADGCPDPLLPAAVGSRAAAART